MLIDWLIWRRNDAKHALTIMQWREHSRWHLRQCRHPVASLELVVQATQNVSPTRTGVADVAQMNTRAPQSWQGWAAAAWTSSRKNVVNADRQTLLPRIDIWRVTKRVDLRVVCITVWMKTMLLHNLQQVSNVTRKRIGPRTEPCGTPNNTANGADLDAIARTYCVRPVR